MSKTLEPATRPKLATSTKFLLGYLVFAAAALLITWLRDSPNLWLEIDSATGVPRVPTNEVFDYDRSNTIVAVVLQASIGLIGTVFGIRELIRTKRPLPLMVSLSGVMIVFPEVFLDIIGMVYFPVDDADNVFTIFGRQMGVFILAGWFGYGVFNYVTFKVLERRPTTRALWLMLLGSALGAIFMEELLQWAGGMYHYYGNQPLELLRLPQWWTPCNAIGCGFLPAVLAYRFREHLQGWRSLSMLVISPLCVTATYGAIAFPSWIVVNGDYPWLITQLAGLATVGLGVLLAAGIMRVLLQRDPFDLSEPARLTDDPALDPRPESVRTTTQKS